MLENWLEQAESEGDDLDWVRRRVAHAFRDAGLASDALRNYQRLLEKYPDDRELLMGRAECLFAGSGGQEAEAMAIYKRVSAMGPQDGGSDYWLAQLRTLQILDRVQKNTHRIGPQIVRLRQQDPMLGGERFRRGFDALQRQVPVSARALVV